MLIASLILFQILIFTGLIFIFRRILNKNVVSATRHLEELNQDYSKKEKEIDRQLEEARKKSEEMLAKAGEEAERQKNHIIKEVEIERDKILNQSRIKSEEIIQQADKSRQLLVSELDERIAKEAVDKACELIQDTLPEEFKHDIHSRWTEELIEDSFSRLERLRIPEEIQEAKITSAFSLNERQRKDFSKKINKMLKHDVTLKEEIDPKLVAGIIVTIGSLVLDGSLRNKIKEQAKSAKYENSEK